MKKLLTFFIVIIALFMGCEQETYHDIDKDTWYLFNENDTIFYLNNGIRADTFIIESIVSGYEVSDKRYYYQRLMIYFKKSKADFHRGQNSVQIDWLNFGAFFIYKNEKVQTYTIDNHLFEKVYREVDIDDSDSDIIKIFYTDLYGIIAYELYNGELYEIDLSCLPEKTK